eukprot:TCONS_00012697-protein
MYNSFKLLLILVLIGLIQTERFYETKIFAVSEKNVVKTFEMISPTQCVLRCQINNLHAVNYKKKCLCVDNVAESTDSLPHLVVQPSGTVTDTSFRYVEIIHPRKEETVVSAEPPISSLVNNQITPISTNGYQQTVPTTTDLNLQMTPTTSVLNQAIASITSAMNHQTTSETMSQQIIPTPSLITALQTSMATPTNSNFNQDTYVFRYSFDSATRPLANEVNNPNIFAFMDSSYEFVNDPDRGNNVMFIQRSNQNLKMIIDQKLNLGNYNICLTEFSPHTNCYNKTELKLSLLFRINASESEAYYEANSSKYWKIIDTGNIGFKIMVKDKLGGGHSLKFFVITSTKQFEKSGTAEVDFDPFQWESYQIKCYLNNGQVQTIEGIQGSRSFTTNFYTNNVGDDFEMIFNEDPNRDSFSGFIDDLSYEEK